MAWLAVLLSIVGYTQASSVTCGGDRAGAAGTCM